MGFTMDLRDSFTARKLPERRTGEELSQAYIIMAESIKETG
jgi:hypothetical protein